MERANSSRPAMPEENRPMTAAGGRPMSTREKDMSLPARPDTARSGQVNANFQEGPTRPTTSGRPVTARPTSSALRKAPSTASRLISTAAMQRPSTRTGVATGIGLTTPISVVDRPITQQGLSGMKTPSRGLQRQVQDKSYYMGLLRTQIGNLTNEITRIKQEIDTMQQEQSSYLTYDKKAKEAAQESTELQGTLSDYNTLVDLINTDTELAEVNEQIRELKDENDIQMNKLDNLFSQKQEKEKIMRQVENEIEEERRMGEGLVEAMQPQLREQYMMLRNENGKLLQYLDQMQQNIDALDTRKHVLQDELALSKVKQEAVELYIKLQELEEKRNEIVMENQQRGTPKEEREKLLLQVKEDNTDIATMERQMAEVQEEMMRLQEDYQQIEQELEENKSERSEKYRELKKREEAMNQFMKTFEETKAEELSRLEEMENSNVALLEKISRNLSHFGNLPSSKDLNTLRGDLSFKKGELEKSQYTEHSLKVEHLNLQANLQKIEALETKVEKEKVELKAKMARMEKDLVEYQDINGLKVRMEEKRKMLILEKEELEIKRNGINQSLREVTNAKEALKKQLNDNETHNQLVNLEKKWSHLEQSNFVYKEFIAQKRAETNFIHLKNQAMKLVQEYNKQLQEGKSSS